MQQKIVTVPTYFQCPISTQIMINPVMLSTGQTYECEEIEKWLSQNDTCPKTNIVLNGSKAAVPNIGFKCMISDFLEQNSILWEDNNPTDSTVYESEKLKQQLILALENNDTNSFNIHLDKDPRFLREDKAIKDNLNLLLLACEKASLNILALVLNKIQNSQYLWVKKVNEYQCVIQDKGLSLFLTVAHRLGLEGAHLLAKTLGLQDSDLQELLNYAVQELDTPEEQYWDGKAKKSPTVDERILTLKKIMPQSEEKSPSASHSFQSTNSSGSNPNSAYMLNSSQFQGINSGNTGSGYLLQSQTINSSSKRKLPSIPTDKKKSLPPKPETGTALYDYTSKETKELSFHKGDTINILEKTGEWWKGELNGKIGKVPSNYINLNKEKKQSSIFSLLHRHHEKKGYR